jgi:hypothetical protein
MNSVLCGICNSVKMSQRVYPAGLDPPDIAYNSYTVLQAYRNRPEVFSTQFDWFDEKCSKKLEEN